MRELAVKQHIARETRVHPADIIVLDDGQCAPLRQYPLNRFPVQITRDGETVRVRSAEPPRLDCGIVRHFWQEIYGVNEWPVADLHVGLIERFVRRVEIIDPGAFE